MVLPVRLVDREFIFRHYRAYHALRVGSAFLLTLILLHYAPLGHSPWVLVTLLVVMSNIPYMGACGKGLAPHSRYPDWRCRRSD